MNDWVFIPGLFIFFIKMGLFKKIINLGNLCQFDTTYTEIVPTLHDFCHVIFLKTKYCLYIEIVSTLHDFCHVIFFKNKILFIYWVVSYVMLKINLIHNFLSVVVLTKKLDNVYASCPAPLNIKKFAYIRY